MVKFNTGLRVHLFYRVSCRVDLKNSKHFCYHVISTDYARTGMAQKAGLGGLVMLTVASLITLGGIVVTVHGVFQ